MHELQYADLVHGEVVVTFDGRVVEVFTDRLGSIARLHLRLLHVTVDGPDRKGRHEVKLTTQPKGEGGGTTLFVPEQAWVELQPFLVNLTEAAADR